jgi:hypothetical protein
MSNLLMIPLRAARMKIMELDSLKKMPCSSLLTPPPMLSLVTLKPVSDRELMLMSTCLVALMFNEIARSRFMIESKAISVTDPLNFVVELVEKGSSWMIQDARAFALT